MHAVTLLELLLLLMLANGTPVIVKRVLGARLGRPLDGGAHLWDGRPVFGASKTIRGIAFAVVVTVAGSLALGLGGTVGAVVGATAMAGDLGSRFVKRRLGLPPHAVALGLGHVPESPLPPPAPATAPPPQLTPRDNTRTRGAGAVRPPRGQRHDLLGRGDGDRRDRR